MVFLTAFHFIAVRYLILYTTNVLTVFGNVRIAFLLKKLKSYAPDNGCTFPVQCIDYIYACADVEGRNQKKHLFLNNGTLLAIAYCDR